MRFKTLITETLLMEKFIPEFSYTEIGDIFDKAIKPIEKTVSKDDARKVRALAFATINNTSKWQRFREELVQFANSDYGLGKTAKELGFKDVDKNTAFKFARKCNADYKDIFEKCGKDIKDKFTEELKKAISEKTKQTEMNI